MWRITDICSETLIKINNDSPCRACKQVSIASNSHLVVQMPQPMHLFGSMFLLILIQEKKPSPGQKPPEKA